jgi:hypothetical protein
MRVLFALALLGCASAPPVPACRRTPTFYEQCADHCAQEELGSPLLWENQSETFCMCRKGPPPS